MPATAALGYVVQFMMQYSLLSNCSLGSCVSYMQRYLTSPMRKLGLLGKGAPGACRIIAMRVELPECATYTGLTWVFVQLRYCTIP